MKFVEMFAGAGGLGRGLVAAGFKHGVSFELGAAAHDVLVRSGVRAYKTDLNDIASTAFLVTGRPDIIVGGPPCQDFSKAGSREEKENARLTPIYAMTIAVLRPQWFLFENVDRAPYYRSYHHARATWKRAGYGLTEVYVNASEYGVPQNRVRFLCIGRLGERDGFLETAIREAAAQRPMTVQDILDPRRYSEDRELAEKGYFWARPWSGKTGEVGGRGVRAITETCPTIVRTTHEAPGPSYVAHPDDAIPAKDAHILTLQQIARFQGFPDGFDFRGKKYKYAREGWSERDIKQMIANAVPSPLGEAIGRIILARDDIDSGSIPALDPGFADFLRKTNPRTGRKGLTSKASIANVLSRVNRARRLLNGRTYASAAEELAALEQTAPYSFKPIESRQPDADPKAFKKGTMDVKSKSDLRSALRLYREFQDGLPLAKFAALAHKAEVRSRTLFPRRKSTKRRPKFQPFDGTAPKLNGKGSDFELSRPMTDDELDLYFGATPEPAGDGDDWRPDDYWSPIDD